MPSLNKLKCICLQTKLQVVTNVMAVQHQTSKLVELKLKYLILKDVLFPVENETNTFLCNEFMIFKRLSIHKNKNVLYIITN